jgi:hypothetical protein
VTDEKVDSEFFSRPILNSPYHRPGRHWELDAEGQPTSRIMESRRRSELITPVPKPKRQKTDKAKDQANLDLRDAQGISSAEQEYNPTPIINEVRGYVEAWRNLPNPDQWGVTPETQRLLQHWRHHNFQGVKPFFCQVEAVETAIWLAEVAPKSTNRYGKFLEHLLSCTRFLWTHICPRRDQNDGVQHDDEDRSPFCRGWACGQRGRARNVSAATVDLAAAPLAVQVTKRRAV